jgi:hypothetical protein
MAEMKIAMSVPSIFEIAHRYFDKGFCHVKKPSPVCSDPDPILATIN